MRRFLLSKRYFLTAFLVAAIAVCAIVSWIGFRDGDTAQRVGIVAAAAVGLAGTALQQFLLRRRGLVVLDPEQRERNPERGLRPGIWPSDVLLGAFLIAALVFEDLRVLILPLLGGGLLGWAPLLLRSAWGSRPDGFTAS